ncbi:MAG TPA: polyphosphate polymerase domain-containing protein [Phytomonospora sp.]
MSDADLRAPTALHAFNRYEIKYLIDRKAVAALRPELTARLAPDPYSGTGGYGVWSTYYDTAALRFYWEKIEGLRFRRKLRIRHYGDRSTVGPDSPVHVEIKQRVGRVTQKRRIRLPYATARELCDGRRAVDAGKAGAAFVDEVLGLVAGLDLRPVAMTGYQREAYLGTGADLGLRVTMDHRVRGRDRDFDLAAEAENRLIVPASMTILEVKADDRVPYWLTDLTARHGLSVVRVSKYCQSVESFGRAPRSLFHVPEEFPATVSLES